MCKFLNLYIELKLLINYIKGKGKSIFNKKKKVEYKSKKISYTLIDKNKIKIAYYMKVYIQFQMW